MINIGATLFLELSNNHGEVKRYRSKLLDISEDQLFIDYPVDDETKKPHYFLKGTQFKVWFLGKDQAIYLFNTEVIGKAEKTIPMLVMKDPGGKRYIRIQRRQYVRIDTSIDVAIHPLETDFVPFTSITIDISGGGMAVVLPENHSIEINKNISVWLSLSYQSGDIQYIKETVRVIRILEERRRLKCSLQFIDINEVDRQKIVRFCFEKQLALRKKESMQ